MEPVLPFLKLSLPAETIGYDGRGADLILRSMVLAPKYADLDRQGVR